jgi:hypothetical protein
MIRTVSKIALLSLAILGAGVGGCADVSDFLDRNVLMDEDASAGLIVKGTYHQRLGGDVFEYPCKTGETCREILVRDEYLRDHYVELDGKVLTLKVERTNACHDTRSSIYACKTSKNGTAFLILQWIDPSIGVLGGLG